MTRFPTHNSGRVANPYTPSVTATSSETNITACEYAISASNYLMARASVSAKQPSTYSLSGNPSRALTSCVGYFFGPDRCNESAVLSTPNTRERRFVHMQKRRARKHRSERRHLPSPSSSILRDRNLCLHIAS